MHFIQSFTTLFTTIVFAVVSASPVALDWKHSVGWDGAVSDPLSSIFAPILTGAARVVMPSNPSAYASPSVATGCIRFPVLDLIQALLAWVRQPFSGNLVLKYPLGALPLHQEPWSKYYRIARYSHGAQSFYVPKHWLSRTQFAYTKLSRIAEGYEYIALSTPFWDGMNHPGFKMPAKDLPIAHALSRDSGDQGVKPLS
jgi:hypothetical protein